MRYLVGGLEHLDYFVSMNYVSNHWRSEYFPILGKNVCPQVADQKGDHWMSRPHVMEPPKLSPFKKQFHITMIFNIYNI
jgi:hypothetical protein